MCFLNRLLLAETFRKALFLATVRSNSLKCPLAKAVPLVTVRSEFSSPAGLRNPLGNSAFWFSSPSGLSTLFEEPLLYHDVLLCFLERWQSSLFSVSLADCFRQKRSGEHSSWQQCVPIIFTLYQITLLGNSAFRLYSPSIKALGNSAFRFYSPSTKALFLATVRSDSIHPQPKHFSWQRCVPIIFTLYQSTLLDNSAFLLYSPSTKALFLATVRSDSIHPQPKLLATVRSDYIHPLPKLLATVRSYYIHPLPKHSSWQQCVPILFILWPKHFSWVTVRSGSLHPRSSLGTPLGNNKL